VLDRISERSKWGPKLGHEGPEYRRNRLSRKVFRSPKQNFPVPLFHNPGPMQPSADGHVVIHVFFSVGINQGAPRLIIYGRRFRWAPIAACCFLPVAQEIMRVLMPLVWTISLLLHFLRILPFSLQHWRVRFNTIIYRTLSPNPLHLNFITALPYFLNYIQAFINITNG